MPRKHAFLSASSAHRWLECTASPTLEKGIADTSSFYAQEGTLAHAIAESILLGEDYESLTESDLYYPGMIDEVMAYTDYVSERFREAKEKDPYAVLLIEERLDFSRYVPEGFGTGDAVIFGNGTLEVIDLKFGKGVQVDACMNPQLMLYGLGALELLGFMYEIDTVTLTVAQVRLDFSSYTLPARDLLDWGQSIIPIAKKAMEGTEDPNPGDWCRFCKFRNQCQERNAYMQELAKEHAFRMKHTLTTDEVAASLKVADLIGSWAKELKDYALEEALNGTVYPGFKVVEGRSNRKIVDPEGLAQTLLDEEYKEEQIYKPKEIETLTNLEKIVGKKKFAELGGAYIQKPPGKPVLVEETDKRPSILDVTEELEFEN